jgi:hypothetical protein
MSWCPEIYRGLFIQPIGKDNIKVAPCCAATLSNAKSSFNFSNDEYLTALRQDKKPEACFYCWNIEDSAGYSKRLAAIDYYNINESDQVELNALEYNVNWACNLACIMCGPDSSSTWAQELKLEKDYNKITHTQNNILDNLDKSKLTRVHFNGGEPLINDDHVKFLDKIDKLPKCKITYNTNGTKLPSNTALERWQRAKMVRLFFSIDATEESFEYIRWPGKWETIEKNIQWFLKNSPSNVMFGLNVTVGAYNLLEIDKVWDWFNATIPTNREGDKSDFNWQVASGFEYNYLPDQIKHDALDKLRLYPELQSLYNSIQINSSISDTWIERLDIIDKRRGTNWKQSLEIGKYFK